MGNRIYNILSVFLLLATVVAVVFFAVQLTQPLETQEAAVLPTQFVPPTATDTPVPTDTPTPRPTTAVPTDTPEPTDTVEPTETVPPSDTPEPSATPSNTITPSPTVTPTPSSTFTPENTDTPTPTPTATGPSPTSPPPLPFGLQGEVTFGENLYNSAGCQWQGIGGQVLDINGDPYTRPLVVHVFNTSQTIDVRVNTGTNSNYGPSGFEVQVGTTLTMETFFAELQTTNGTIISEPVQVDFPGICGQNAAIVTFQQLR